MTAFGRRLTGNRRLIVRTHLAWLSIAVSVAGCTVGENYRRPDIAAPAVFRGVAPDAPADSTPLADLKWFEVFKDEHLQALIRTALVRNHDVRDAVVRVEAARAALGITRADQFPAVDAVASAATVRSSANGSVPAPEGVDRTQTFGTVGVSLLSFELDLWGRLRRATEAARADLLAAEYNRKAVMTTLVSDVATAYFNLLELDMELAIAQRTLGVRADALELIRNRERGGLGTLLDVRQGEQLVYGAEQVIPALEQLVEQTENQISLLLGGAPGAIPRGHPLEEQQQPPAVPPGLPSSLLDRRPDIQAAEQNLVAANAIVGVARAAYFPRISLTGLLGFQSDQLAGLFGGPARVWQFVPQVTQPIFNGGRLRSNVNLAKAQQQLTLIEYDRVIQTAFREVSDVLVQYQKVREIRAKQELLVGTLRDRARMSRVRYAGGIDPLLNALDAERDLFNAELTLVQTTRNELLAVVRLYRALGGGWQQ